MQLVGATHRFIRRPFIIKGVIQGIIGALIAILILMGIVYVSQRQFPDLINLEDINIFLILFGFVILLGVLISWLSNFFAVRKYIKIKTDNLYY
jgi:cell division transport system permease protein